MTADDAILALADKSAILHYAWHSRGVAPPAYIRGMALAFAQTCRRFKAGHPAAIEMAKANTHNDAHDALSWYNSNFAALGMHNDAAGPDTLRHLFVLMLGHAMRESSGQHCCGWDTEKDRDPLTALSAEAGLFQTSYNAHVCSPLFDPLMDEFAAGKANGYLAVFSQGVHCGAGAGGWVNFGTGRGAAFQDLCKKQPAFAVESAALVLRNLCRHYGPIIAKAAELRPEADSLFREIQDYIDQQGESA